jgi:hypothetical protein
MAQQRGGRKVGDGALARDDRGRRQQNEQAQHAAADGKHAPARANSHGRYSTHRR